MRTTSSALVVAILGCVGGTAAGCGGPMTKLRGENTTLAGDVDKLRAELRAERRTRQDLENQVLVLKDQLETASQRAPAALPSLPVEVLTPDDVPENGQLVGVGSDGVEIVYVDEATRPPVEVDTDELDGARAPAPRSRPRPAPPGPDLDELPSSADLEAGVKVRDLPTRPPRGYTPIAAPAPRAPRAATAEDDDAADQAAALYRRGTAALKSHEYEAAIGALREVVTRFPRHDLADNAQYWLGEAYYDQKDFGRALAEFRATVTAYPRGNKAADALLKVGFAYQALGEAAKARAALEQVVALYPGSPPANLAAGRLETLP